MPEQPTVDKTQASVRTVDEPPPELCDQILVERVIQGDASAFSLLYDRHAPAVYATAAYLLGDIDAEDVVQEAFLRLRTHARQFDAIGMLSS